MSATAIELRGLVRRFGERIALRDLTLTVPAGTTLAVLGRNGAGKSTLLRILATLLRPHGGEASVLGEPLPGRAFAIRPQIGYVGHDPLLYRDLSGRENLTYHARLHGVEPARVEALLDAVEMRARADDPVRSLSRGMVQRLSICRAVLHQPRVLLLDEAKANLDPGAGQLVEPMIGRAARVTRVLSSHDPQDAMAEADFVLGLRDGRMEFAGPVEAVDRRRLEELYQ
jgi:heme exporter protein A